MPLLRVRCALVGVLYAVAMCTLCVGGCTLCRCYVYVVSWWVYSMPLLRVRCALVGVLYAVDT